uniref:28S ribosomal protein S18b, mitochondrial (inferred by orthology to a human protein) n=1 Tax=Strongyloides venezuelensis TaxID=75913 RepID=A0A0K0FFL5_STRVS
MSTTPTEFQYVIPTKVKNSTRKHPHHKVTIKKYIDNPRFCPFQACEYCLSKSKNLRTTNKLFITLNKPHTKILGSTIARWLLQFLRDHKINSLSAHGIKKVSCSKVYQ